MAQWDNYGALAASSSVASSESERDDFESSTAMDDELSHPTSPLSTASASPPSPSSPPSQGTTTTALAAPADTSLSGSTAATNTTHLAPTAPGNTGQHQLAGSGQPSREGEKSLTTLPYRHHHQQRQQLQRRRFSLMEKSRRAFTVKAMELKKRLPFAVDRRRLHAKSARRAPLGARAPRPTGSGGGRRPWRLTVIELHASDDESDSDRDHNSNSGGGGGGAKQRVVSRVTCHAPPDAQLTREYLRTVGANNNNNGGSSSSDHATSAGSAVYCDRMNTPIGRVRCLPCSLSCSGVAVSALLPDLQCVVCQCRYHSHCVRLPPVAPPSPLTGAASAHFVCLECYQLMTGSASLSSQARFHWPTHTDYTLTAAAGGGGGGVGVVGVPLSCGQWHAPDSPAALQLADSSATADCAAAAAAAEAADDDWFSHSLFEASPVTATTTATTDINTTAATLEAAPSSEYDQNYTDGDYLGTPALFGRGGVPLSQAHSHGLTSASLHHTPSSTSTPHGADERGPASVRGSGRGRGRGRPPLTARGDWTPRSERAGAAHAHHSKTRKKLSTKAAAKAAANSGKPSAEGSEASLPAAAASVAAAAPAAAVTDAASDSLPLTAAVDTSPRPGLAPGAAPPDDPAHHQWEPQSAAGSGSAPAGAGGVKKRSWVVS